MTPLVVVRLSEIRMGLDRPDHPNAKDGRLWVYIEKRHRGRREYIEAVGLGYGLTYLTTEERQTALEAIAERDRRLEAGDVTL